MKQEEYGEILSAVLELLATEYNKTTMELWFSQLTIVSLSPKKVVLQVPISWKRDILRSKYFGSIKSRFTEVLGFDVDIEINSAEDVPPIEQKVEKEPMSAYQLRFHASYTFENFVVGKSNELAQRASLAVAEHPAELNNPLFLYGPSGLGKTHLLFAIMNEARKRFPSYSILYVTSEEFTNELIDAMAQKKPVEFRNKYRNVDILLIDDIQFLAGKVYIQEEFFHTFDALYTGRKQIIIASDRPPRQIDNIDERLKSRFESGLIADIQPPDLELRIAIFKRKAIDLKFEVPNDVLLYLAENIKLNIRQIEGALNKLRAQSFILGKNVTLELTQEVLGEFLKTAENDDNTVDRIFKYVTNRYGVSKEQLKGVQRSSEIAFPRHVAIYLVRSLTNMSLKSIAKVFSRKDHTSVMNSITVVEQKLKTDAAFERDIRQAIDELSTQ